MISWQIGPGGVATLLGAVFAVLGLVFVVLGIRTLGQVAARRRTWIRYPGEAFDYVWHGGGRNSQQYWMLRWIDRDGVQRTAENPYGSSGGTLRSFPFPVDVLVNPENPREATVAEGARSGILTGWLFSLVGGLFAVIGLGMLAVRFGGLFTGS